MGHLVPLQRGERFHTLVVDVSYYNAKYKLDASTNTSFRLFDSYSVLPRVGPGHGFGKWDLWLGNKISLTQADGSRKWEMDPDGTECVLTELDTPGLVVVRDLGSLERGGAVQVEAS
jgi:hypothetical protein